MRLWTVQIDNAQCPWPQVDTGDIDDQVHDEEPGSQRNDMVNNACCLLSQEHGHVREHRPYPAEIEEEDEDVEFCFSCDKLVTPRNHVGLLFRN